MLIPEPERLIDANVHRIADGQKIPYQYLAIILGEQNSDRMIMDDELFQIMSGGMDNRDNIVENRAIGDNIFHLGWKSIARFKKVDDGLLLTYNESYVNRPRVNERAVFGQIVTRSVATCTFAFIETEDEIVVLHSDEDTLDNCKRYLTEAELVPTRVFVSYVQGDRENRFVNYLIRQYGNRVDIQRFLRFIGNLENVDNDIDKCLYHTEIGVYMNLKREIKLFGDLTFMNSQNIPISNGGQRYCCIQFDEREAKNVLQYLTALRENLSRLYGFIA